MKTFRALFTFAVTALIIVLIGLAIWNQIQKRVPAVAAPIKKVVG